MSKLSSTAELRSRARGELKNGAVTKGYAGDRKAILALLDAALATELVCVLRYKRHSFVASGIRSAKAAAEFHEHAQQELEHVDALATRIVQLGGEPDFSPATLVERSHAEYVEGTSLAEMIRENLVAERIAIESYKEAIRYVGDDDPTTRRMLEDILAVEEEHADDLADLLDTSHS